MTHGPAQGSPGQEQTAGPTPNLLGQGYKSFVFRLPGPMTEILSLAVQQQWLFVLTFY